MLRKLLIRVYLGPLPAWYPQWIEHMDRLKEFGWHVLICNSRENFTARCAKTFGFPVEVLEGTRRVGDFAPAYGLLFADELKHYDFWGHVDLDCVFGRVERFVTDELLSQCDIFANDPGSICGPFTLYRNTPKVNELFHRTQWRSVFSDPSDHVYGFDEGEFNQLMREEAAAGQIRLRSAFWQSHDGLPWHQPYPKVRLQENGALFDEAQQQELMMFHFHRYRQWPLLRS